TTPGSEAFKAARFYLRNSSGQVRKPSSEYNGQKRNSPVTSGTTPSQPHQPTVPDAASTNSTSPTKIRSTRSIPPTFAFMVFSFGADSKIQEPRYGLRPMRTPATSDRLIKTKKRSRQS